MKNIILLIFLTIILTACADKTDTKLPETEAGLLTARLRDEKDELIRKRMETIAATLRLSPSVLMPETTNENQKSAQNLASKDARFITDYVRRENGRDTF